TVGGDSRSLRRSRSEARRLRAVRHGGAVSSPLGAHAPLPRALRLLGMCGPGAAGGGVSGPALHVPARVLTRLLFCPRPAPTARSSPDALPTTGSAGPSACSR